MKIFNMHEAKTHLSDLIDKAVFKGESFIIAKAGKPMVRVTRIDAPVEYARVGFLVGQIQVSADFDRIGAKRIVSFFEGRK